MRRLLLATAALLLCASAASAAVITDFGLDPTSATGAFQHSLGASTSFFDDQYTFKLDQPMTLTIASVTNVFPQSADFIAGFTGSVFNTVDGIIGNGNDVRVIGPVAATQGCGPISLCQGFAGSAFLDAGTYYLDVSGTAGGTSGYGGNLATFAVPGPSLGAGLPGLLAGVMAWLGWRRRRRETPPVA